MEAREIVDNISISFYDDEMILEIETDESRSGWKLPQETYEQTKRVILQTILKEPDYRYVKGNSLHEERNQGVKRMDLFHCVRCGRPIIYPIVEKQQICRQCMPKYPYQCECGGEMRIGDDGMLKCVKCSKEQWGMGNAMF